MATVERTKLYRQLWSIPGAQLAIMYGISDVGLAKVCKRYSIPRPPRGYWARLAAGQHVPRPPLPKMGKGPCIVRLKGWNMSDKTIQQFAADQRNQATSSTSPPSESTPHPLVVATRAQIPGLKPDHEGRIRTNSETALDLHISPALAERCLGVMDMLIKRWETRGGTIRAGAGNEKNKTAFAIGPDEFYIEGVEAVDESKPLTDPTRLSGRLTIFIKGDERREFRRRWADTKTQRLEKMINPLIETLSTVLAVIKAERLDAECLQRQKQTLEARRKAEATRASREFYWRQELMESVGRWHAAQQIRAYLDDLTRSVEDGRSRINDENAFKTWMDWARRYADSIDPIRSAPLPGDVAIGPKNTPIADVQLTSYTAPALAALNVKDTDQLARVTGEQVRSVAGRHISDVWSEITRILAGLGYPVSKRRDVWY
jgi:hypothetical protein